MHTIRRACRAIAEPNPNCRDRCSPAILFCGPFSVVANSVARSLRSVYIHQVLGRNTMRALLVILLAMSSPVFAAESDGLIGNWKLVSWQAIVDNEAPQHLFVSNPEGYLIL